MGNSYQVKDQVKGFRYRHYLHWLVVWISRILAKNYYVSEVCRIVVGIYDNDMNGVDIKNNGELKVLRHLVKKSENDDVFFDVGANIGLYSVELINAGLKGSLFLVDPLKNNLSSASQRIKQTGFKKYQLLECALSNQNGTQLFNVNLDSSLSGADSFYDMRKIGYLKNTTEIQVPVKKLDDLAISYDIKKVYFLKIDTEGNEFFVLKGAEELLSRQSIKFIQFEFGNSAKVARVFLHDIVYFLESKKFKIFIIKPKGLFPLKFTPYTEKRYSLINFLAVHESCVGCISEIVISR
jgi:FkbM family methyltransferase